MAFNPVSNQLTFVLIGLVLAAWTLAAAFVILRARARLDRAQEARHDARRLARLVDESPAVPLLVRTDGRIEAPPRLAGWLGLETLPAFLSELDAGADGLETADLAALSAAVQRTQKTSAPFRMIVTPRGAGRRLALRGHLADPQVSPGGAALVWAYEAIDGGVPAAANDRQRDVAAAEPAALERLFAALPLPIWMRGPDGNLRFVNSAYAEAVGEGDPGRVLEQGIELVEPIAGATAQDIARQVAAEGAAAERIVTATINGERRAIRVTDVPLGELGSGGCAVDIEAAEVARREYEALRTAKRVVLDDVSAAIARFDLDHKLSFANDAFRRIFALDAAVVASEPSFEKVLDLARSAGRLPEVRDFLDWRRERLAWFDVDESQEEAWSLPTGQHLRLVVRRQPDGGIMLIAEDRTEQLRLSAIRDTMLRTRTATLDSLFESVALFAPDGRMELWSRRFASDWGLESEFLDTHPHVQGLARKIAPRLKRPGEAESVSEAVRRATLDRAETGGRIQLADGRTLAYAGVPLPDGNGLLTVLDMTDAQTAEEALRARNAALQEAADIRARFLADLGQEFRHPLAVIGGFAERMRDGLGGDLNDVGHEYIGEILASVDRIDANIEQLLALSRGDPQTLVPGREEIELFPLAHALVMERKPLIDANGLTLDLRGDASAGRVTGDRQRLSRAIGTLLDQAIAATPHGGRILLELTRLRGPSGGPARIVVSDNGAGMDEETLSLAHSGNLAVAGVSTLTRRGGLPLARALIEAVGGTFDYHSEPGIGSAVIVELP